jgi:hypothetical protein
VSAEAAIESGDDLLGVVALIGAAPAMPEARESCTSPPSRR